MLRTPVPAPRWAQVPVRSVVPWRDTTRPTATSLMVLSPSCTNPSHLQGHYLTQRVPPARGTVPPVSCSTVPILGQDGACRGRGERGSGGPRHLRCPTDTP